MNVPYNIIDWWRLPSYLKIGGENEVFPVYPIYASSRTQYVSITGDKNPVIALNTASGTLEISLNNFMKQEQINDLKARFKLMPRSEFDAFVKNVTSSIEPIKINTYRQSYQNIEPVTYTVTKAVLEEVIKTNLLELFNQANKEECDLTKTLPIDWEKQKVVAYYKAQAQAEIDKNIIFQPIIESGLTNVQKEFVKAELEARYMKLTKIADPVLELQRSLAINALLNQEKFQLASDIILFYETLSDKMNNVIASKA